MHFNFPHLSDIFVTDRVFDQISSGMGEDMNDLYMFDTKTVTWTNLSEQISGTPPLPRHSFGFASNGGKLYVFGGLNAVSCK